LLNQVCLVCIAPCLRAHSAISLPFPFLTPPPRISSLFPYTPLFRSSRSPHAHIQPTSRAGTPATSPCAGTSRVTTAPAPTNEYGPRVTPHTTVALAPTVAPRPTRVGRSWSIRRTSPRGLTTLVNTQDGPRDAPSSMVTPR